MQHVWHALFNLQLCFCRSEVWKSNRFGIIFLWWHQKTKRHVKTPSSFWKLKIENFMLYTSWIHVIMKQLRLYQFGFWNLATLDICGNNDFLGIGYERPRSVVDYGGCCQLRTGAPPPPCSASMTAFSWKWKEELSRMKQCTFSAVSIVGLFSGFSCDVFSFLYIACCHEQNQVQVVKHIMRIPFLICMPLGFARPEPFCLHALNFEAVFRARLAGFISNSHYAVGPRCSREGGWFHQAGWERGGM